MVNVLVTDQQDDHPVDAQRWATLAKRTLEAEGAAAEAELSMAFVDEGVMAGLNQRFAGVEGATDVLAFPIDPMDVEVLPEDPPPLLGDVVICPAVANRNALVSDASHRAATFDDEVALLVVHGVLHLLGMDHEDPLEAERMQRRERDLLDRFHAATPAPH